MTIATMNPHGRIIHRDFSLINKIIGILDQRFDVVNLDNRNQPFGIFIFINKISENAQFGRGNLND